MSFRLYVGNYPISFTEKDLQNLFHQFPGITIDQIHKKNPKCYAFIVCKDIDQLVSVIEKMNNADVSGRKLKVRASDRSLQEYVDLLFQETNDNNDNNSHLVPPSLVPLQVRRNEHCSHQAYETDGFEQSSVNSSLNGFQRKHENNLHESAENKSCHSSRVKLNSPNTKNKDNKNAFDINSVSSSRSQNNYPQKNEKTTGTSHENDPLLYQKSSGSAKSTTDGCLEKKVMRNEHRSHQAYETDGFEQSSVNSSLNGFQRKHENNLHESAENKSCHSSRVKLNSPNTKNKDNNTAFDINSFSSSRSQNNYPRKNEKTTGTSHENDPLLYQKSSGRAKSETYYPSSPSKYSYQQRSEKFKNQPRVQYEESACYSHSSSEYEHDHDYYTGEYNGVSPRKNYAKNLHQKYDEKEFTWVSVTNFPIGCSVSSIFELFSDYDPIRVNMICNVARRDKTLTEAHVCFWNQDIANDVILNYDNTMFQGRVILVNDLEDLTMMKELLDVAHS